MAVDTAFPAILAKNTGTAGSLTNIKLGKSSTTTNDFGGDLGELLIFTRQLSTGEEQKVEGYLAHRWGSTDSLNTGHPYKNVAPIFDNKPLIRDISEISNWDDNISAECRYGSMPAILMQMVPPTPRPAGNISSWLDKSGKGHHANSANGTPLLKTTSGPNSGRVIEIRGGDYLPVSGSFFVKDMFFVFRSFTANTTWSGYGGPIWP